MRSPASLRLLIAILLGTIAVAAASTSTADAGKPRTWDLTGEYAAHKKLNPAPDKFGHSEVWSWMYGEAGAPSSYALMESFYRPAFIKRECGVKGFSQWDRSSSFFQIPAVFYNAGPALERGQNSCAESTAYPTKTFFMHPDNASSLAAIAAWRSPITGTVTISGSVQPMDSSIEGVVWQLDKGSSILAGPAAKNDDSLTTFGPISVPVHAGESLYLALAPGAHGGSYDTTALTLDITE